MIKSTIDLAHSLGMSVMAEGVETAEALALLGALGADTVQGYHIARPLPLSELIDLLGEQNLQNPVQSEHMTAR